MLISSGDATPPSPLFIVFFYESAHAPTNTAFLQKATFLCSPEFLLRRRNVVFATNMRKSQTPSRPHVTGDTTPPNMIFSKCLPTSGTAEKWFQTKLVLCSQRLVGSLEYGWSQKRRKLLTIFGCMFMARFSPKRNRTPRPRYQLFCLCSFEGERSRELRMVSVQN